MCLTRLSDLTNLSLSTVHSSAAISAAGSGGDRDRSWDEPDLARGVSKVWPEPPPSEFCPLFAKPRKRKPAIFVVAAICGLSAVLVSEGALGGGDEAQRERLLSEYRVALDRLESSYSRLRGSGVVSENRRSRAKGATASRTRFTFFVDGENVKISKEGDTGKYLVESVNAKYAFRAGAAKKGDPLVLTRLREKEARGLALAVGQFKRDYLLAPFSIRVPIKELLWDSKTTVIGKVSTVAADGRELVKIEYTRSHRFQGVPSELKCWMLLDPNQGWALVEHDASEVSGPRQTHTKIDYGHPRGGVPTPARITITTLPTEYTYEFDEFTFDPTPESEFTLTSVGLPEIAPPSNSRLRHSWFWPLNLLAAGILLLVAVIRTMRGKRGNCRAT